MIVLNTGSHKIIRTSECFFRVPAGISEQPYSEDLISAISKNKCLSIQSKDEPKKEEVLEEVLPPKDEKKKVKKPRKTKQEIATEV